MEDKFIPSIYNYCDRWCERCTFTSRCRSFERTSKLTPEQTDITNKAFWENIASNFKEGIKLLHEGARKHGIDLDAAIASADMVAIERQRRETKAHVRQHPLIALCKQYEQVAFAFAEKRESIVPHTDELVSHHRLDIKSGEEILVHLTSLRDCLEVIQWYLFFIDAKLQRALHGKIEGEEWAVENGFPKDSDGSAKVALIAIERSSQAWVKLYDILPDHHDTIISALRLLGLLDKAAREEFPEAMQFRRPGFDD